MTGFQRVFATAAHGSTRTCAQTGELLNDSLLRAAERMHLQWFAAEDEGRTEDPTEQKLRKSREEEGKVAKSQDTTSAVILLVGVLTIFVLSGWLWNGMQEMMMYFLRQIGEVNVATDHVLGMAFYHYFIRLAAPVAAVSFVAAWAGNLVQVGFLFTTKPLMPDPKRIAPNFGKWAKKSFASEEAGFNLAKSLGKVIMIAAIGFFNVQALSGQLVNLVYGTIGSAVAVIAGLAFRVLLQTSLLFLVLSLFDYVFQRRQHIESLKMTKEEVKEERKNYEGDPLIRNRLRQRMQEVLSSNMMQRIPDADVVITNPTHFAVALEYDRIRMDAPTVTAKGQDHVAQKIRERARENNVPIVENKPLARALHAEVEIGDSIPEKYYEAVVKVLKYVYSLSGAQKRQKWWGGN